MKYFFASLLIIFALFFYFSSSSKEHKSETVEHAEQSIDTANLKSDVDSVGSIISELASSADSSKEPSRHHDIAVHLPVQGKNGVDDRNIAVKGGVPLAEEEVNIHSSEFEAVEEIADEVREKLPGEEVNFRLKLHTSTHHMIDGKATSDIGGMLLKSRLMPSNEVKLSVKLKQGELDDIELTAYIDLANFTMELDGSNGVLNVDHKQVMKFASAHIRSKFETQYESYDVPEHALMLVQMIGYWSVSPEGYVHEKRSVVGQ